jgi:four helix bundle protein
MGSACELEYHLQLALDLHLLGPPEHERLTQETSEVKRMLTAFIRRLRPNSKAVRADD